MARLGRSQAFKPLIIRPNMGLVDFDKSRLLLINKRSLRYNPPEAEKDYFLAIASQIINKSTLKEKLVFKGGTAIHHCYLDQLRFSEDLDFTSLDRTITLEEVKEVLEKNGLFKVKEEYFSKATIKLKLQYTGPLQQANSLKVEIDFIQNVVLSAKEGEYKNVLGLIVKTNVMDIKEICAEKIRAMSDRARYRDFYDFYQILKNFDIKLDEIIELVRQKEIRKPISEDSIKQNWQFAKQGKQSESARVFYKEDVPDEEVEKIIEKLSFEDLPKNFEFQD